MKIEELLKPISNSSSCGPDLEYDAELQALGRDVNPQVRMFDEKPHEPKWDNIEIRAETLLCRSKDLRVAFWLTRAWTHRNGIAGLASGLQLIHGLLTQYWESIHPCLEVEDQNNPEIRLNILAQIGDYEILVRDVQNATISFQDVKLPIRNILEVQGKLSIPENHSGYTQAQIEEIFRAEKNVKIVQDFHDLLGGTLQTLRNIQHVFAEKIAETHRLSIPDFKKLNGTLEPILDLCKNAIVSVQQVEEESHSVDGAAVLVNSNASSQGDIRCREDVVRMLEKVCKYIERTEPTNPASLVIRFAQSLMTKNFVEIMEVLPPEDLKIFKKIVDSDRKK